MLEAERSAPPSSPYPFDNDLEFCGLSLDTRKFDHVTAELHFLHLKMHGLAVDAECYEERASYPVLGPSEAYEDYVLRTPDGTNNNGPGKRYMWRGINLTWSASHPDPYRLKLTERRDATRFEWTWNPVLHLPHTKELVEQLGARRLLMVRAMALPAGHLGFFHADGKENAWSRGFQQVNITLKSGGVPLVARIKDKYRAISDPAFAFNDRNIHGVPQGTSNRLILVVVGELDLDTLRGLARPDSYISRGSSSNDVDRALKEFTGGPIVDGGSGPSG